MKQKIIQALPDKLFVALKQWGWYGSFKSWRDAEEKSIGYGEANILEKVKEALLKVKEGSAVYERDSYLFDKIEYSWELLSALMWIAALNKGHLNLIDFGGSLGSCYFQNKLFLDKLTSVSWNIVEQENFVQTGKDDFEDERLHFFYSIEDCIKAYNKNDVKCVLFSSVLQYLEKPYETIGEVANKKIDYIILDRTGFTYNDTMRLTVQKVYPKIYSASYPCWFFSETELISFLKKKGYKMICDFDSLDTTNIKANYKGFMFQLC